MTKYRHGSVDGTKVFYREAGPANAPAILLLHDFPTSSRMFRNLIPALADNYHVVAPDLPGFGFSDAPDRKNYRLHLREDCEDDCGFHSNDRPQSLRHVRLRLWRSCRLSPVPCAPRANRGDRLAERQRV
jgi:pimeloyl-ACP methyl ester carboxylesterase